MNRSRLLSGPVLFLALIFIAAVPSEGVAGRVSEDRLWVNMKGGQEGGRRWLEGQAPGAVFKVNLRRAKQIVRAARHELKAKRIGRTFVMSLPMPNGSFVPVRVGLTPLLSRDLQRRHPNILTFKGESLEDATATVRLDITPRGFHAQLIGKDGVFYVDPLPRGRRILYRSVWKADAVGRPFECGVESAFGGRPGPDHLSPNNPSGDRLREYRLAVTATGEYTQFFGGEAAAAAQIATTVNRVVGIYRREVAVTFQLVAMNIYDDPDTDPFPDGETVNDDLLDQNQTALDDEVGSANYDLGHVFSQGGTGGLASVDAACNAAVKARGGTSLGNPAGDVFDVDFVSHEIGHQVGGHHTFNGTTGSCSGNRNGATAYEPGSGSTLMGYAGICGDEDVQANSDDYFHSASFDEITTFRDGAGALCGTETLTDNLVPVVDAGPDFTLPRETPFVLTASGSDGDDDALTFNWEQFDLGEPSPPADMAAGPLFRSRPPTADPSRTFPRLEDILAGTPTPWELLPTVDRFLTFRATARDNKPDGGGVDHDTMTVTVAGDPFIIIAPAFGEALECGIEGNLLWNVGGGSVADEVAALFSADDGVTFRALITTMPNDGQETFTVPRDLTAAARIRLNALENIFFNISEGFVVEDTLPPELTVPPDLIGVECTSPEGASPDIGSATAVDSCDEVPVLGSNAPAVFPLGDTTVTWAAVDGSGNESTGFQLVNVVDTVAPDIAAPADITAECTSPEGTPVDLGLPVVFDLCDDSVDVSNDGPALYPLGDTTVTWTATDDSGNADADGQVVTVEDTTAPSLDLVLEPSVLWPPNHKLVPIAATVTVNDDCDAAPVVRLVAITSNEPDNGHGDGNTVDDIQGADPGQDDRMFSLRAERSGGGMGRIYTVTFEVEDGSGNTTTRQAEVRVPHDRGGQRTAME